jgi:hypothetical protein
MKQFILICALFLGVVCNAQDSYFTVYNFTVESQDVASVFNLFDDYFSENKPEGVTVSLYENHFNDSGNNFSHSVVFSGSLDAMGDMYSGGDDTWNLFLTRVNQQTESGFSSASGRTITNHGESEEPYPFQRYYLLNVESMSKFETAHKAYMEDNLPDGMTNSMGNISIGRGPDGANVWIIARFQDFKTAIGGSYVLRTEAEREANSKAWEKRREAQGEVSLVRSGLRILLKSW